MTNVHQKTMWSQIADLEHTLEFPEIGGVRTRVLRLGGGEETIVLLNGTTGHIEAFTHNIRALAREYNVIAYDYPAHGYSSGVSEKLEISDYIEHLLNLLEHYGLEQVILCGESLGGWIALKIGQLHPERFSRIILSAPGGRMAPADVLAAGRESTRDAINNPTDELIKLRLEKVILDPNAISDELIDIRKDIYSQDNYLESAEAILALSDPEIRYRNRVEIEDYKSLHIPTLLVWTDNELSGSIQDGTQLAEALPDGQLLLVENSCHWPQWEQPKTFNKTVLQFLRETQKV